MITNRTVSRQVFVPVRLTANFSSNKLPQSTCSCLIFPTRRFLVPLMEECQTQRRSSNDGRREVLVQSPTVATKKVSRKKSFFVAINKTRSFKNRRYVTAQRWIQICQQAYVHRSLANKELMSGSVVLSAPIPPIEPLRSRRFQICCMFNAMVVGALSGYESRGWSKEIF